MYKLRDKRLRNDQMYKLYKERPDLTYREIGAIFNITGVTAWVIIRRMKQEVNNETANL